MTGESIQVTSFNQFGEERVRTTTIPAQYRGQQNISLDGWEITLFDDGVLIIDRSTVAHSDVAMKVTQTITNGETWSVSIKPVVPFADDEPVR